MDLFFGWGGGGLSYDSVKSYSTKLPSLPKPPQVKLYKIKSRPK